jgi:hypothetical protein
MPAKSSVTLTDRGATDHVYAPSGEADGVHMFTKPDANGIPIGDSVLSVSLRKTPENRKVRLKLQCPVVQTETINGVSTPKVVRSNWVDVVFTFNRASSTAEREVLIGQIADALTASQTMLDGVVTDLQDLY